MISENLKQNLFVNLFGLVKVPLIFFVSPKVIELSDEKCIVSIPLKRRTKNHLGSMYFGVLCTGADIAGGLCAMSEIKKSGQKIQLSFKDFKAEFLKRAYEDVHFVCPQNQEIKAFVDLVSKSDERHNKIVKIDAISAKSKEVIAKFELTLSLKKK